jgi:cell wall-associated NlpC family hydrolase
MGLLFRLVCLAVLVGVANVPQSDEQVATGDLVFIASGSSRSELIRRASGSPYSHVGLVEVAKDGVFVIEATQPVSRTPWATFVSPSVGGVRLVRRVKGSTPEQGQRVVARARAWLGRPYDALYRWDDARLYCSELVVKAWAGEGVTLGRVQVLGELQLSAEELVLAESLGLSRTQTLVTPGAVAEDARLETVR